MRSAPPVVLTIAGSDNSAGAGIQADLKTFAALGVYGLTAVTCVVAEVPGRVSAIQAMDASIVRDQIRLSFDAYPVAAMKTGLLYSTEIIETVCETLEELFAKQNAPPFLVVDPVMVATSGDPLLKEGAVWIYKKRLFKLASLVTPNLDEVETLLNRGVQNVDEMRLAGLELTSQFEVPFLLKGGHLRQDIATDLLFENGKVSEFSAPFVKGVSTHGTGCAYSAAIAAGVAKGMGLENAITHAKTFVTAAIQNSFCWKNHGGGTAALNHF